MKTNPENGSLEEAVPHGEVGRECVFFKFHGPPKAKVYLAGTFNGWNPKAARLKETSKGVYTNMLRLPLGRYEYKFVVNGEWCNSPHCTDLVYNSYGTQNSVLNVFQASNPKVHHHTFSRMPNSESHLLWSVPSGG